LYSAASRLKESSERFRPALGRYIASGQLKSNPQLDAALDYLKKLPADAVLDASGFEAACGIGVDVTREEIAAAIAAEAEKVKDRLLEDRYLFPIGNLQGTLRKDARLKWCDGRIAKEVVDEVVRSILGPCTAEDEEAAKKGKAPSAAKKKPAAPPPPPAAAAAAAGGAGGEETKKDVDSHAFAARELASAVNSERLLAEHKAVTGGKIRTRFPPEPNGFLHIGHAKSMCLNFETAFKAVGASPDQCDVTFRYDDTNPEAESMEYIENQAENVHWMGWRPTRVTYTSDYFEQLHAFAVELIKRGKAFVCHQSKADMEKSKEHARHKTGDPNSPWRDRPISENLFEFENMRLGLYDKGKAVLRMKMDMHDPRPCMWDPVAYRIKYHHHPRTGSTWCIYPSYDFSHCLVDSIEHIDYSLCTLEFEARRDSYYWLLEALDLWRPHVWEFSRLNITCNPLSKRKLLTLVTTKTVSGWDDPRICTINGLRRRGYTSEAINNFCRDIGVTRTENVIQLTRLEHFVRQDLNVTSRRGFCVLNPLPVTLTNFPADAVKEVQAPNFPQDLTKGSHTVYLTRTIFIDYSDFRLEDSKTYYGLAPGKQVGIKYAGCITCTNVVKSPEGAVVGLEATYSPETTASLKGHIHWVSPSVPGGPPFTATVRLYSPLFNEEMEMVQGSLQVVDGAVIDASLVDAPVYSRFQFERVGFFVTDPDSQPGRPVFNLTVSLKESAAKKQIE